MSDISYHGAGSITKASRNPDGTVTFEASKAAGPDLDGDEQILDPAWLDKAMGRWFASGGNLREQHQAIAAGKALTLEQPGNGDNFVSGVVVDPVSAMKVEHGVLAGLSVGIKGARVVKDADAPGGRIVDGRIVEVSLVDRPCNPTCKLVMAKADQAGNAVFVEEFDGAKADELESALATLTARVAIAKADNENSDIAGARAALAAIVPLIQSELDGLEAGDLGEQYDVSLLTCAVSDLTAFLASEIAEQRQEITMSDKPDDTKADEAAALTADTVRDIVKTELAEAVKQLTPEPPDPDAVKAEEPDIAKAVKEGIAEVVQPLADALANLTAKVDGIPVGGGPAITRTGHTSDSTSTEKQEWLEFAARPGLSTEDRRRALAKAEALS